MGRVLVLGVLVLVVAGCGSRRQAGQAARAGGLDNDSAALYTGILNSVPVGMALGQAQATMSGQGFSCRSEDGRLVCERQDVLQPGLVRRWHVVIANDGTKVTGVSMTTGMAATVQAREASQLPK